MREATSGQVQFAMKDRLKIVNMVLFFVLGIAILWRTPWQKGLMLAHAFGLGCFLIGGYRFWLVYQVRKQITGVLEQSHRNLTGQEAPDSFSQTEK